MRLLQKPYTRRDTDALWPEQERSGFLKFPVALAELGGIAAAAVVVWLPGSEAAAFPQQNRGRSSPQTSNTPAGRFGYLAAPPMFIGCTFASVLLWRASAQGIPSFGELFAHAFGVFFVFNLVDLLILDWLIVCWYAPGWLILPGSEHIVIPKAYLQHFKGFLTGTVVSAIAGLVVAALLHFLF